MLGTYHSNALFDILKEIHFIYEPRKLWAYVLEEACKALQAEAGTFFELSPDDEEMRVTAACGIDSDRLSQVPFRVGVGIAGWVAQYHQPALVNNVRQDHRFNAQADRVTGFQTKSVLCVPILSQKRSYGVIEILNRKNNQFTPQDQEFMTLLGRQTAVAYHNLVLFNEVQHSKVLLESLLKSLSGGLIAMDAAGTITVMNPSAIQILGISPSNYIGQAADAVLKDHPWFLEQLRKTMQTRATVSRQEAEIPLGGRQERVGYTTILIQDPHHEILGAGVIFQKLNAR
jgi:adenylate cyclase